jgi:DNA-directed RNA polymerase II subunit RPB1
MSQRTKGVISKKKASKIIGIQFGIPSAEEIERGSVAEITTRDTIVNNKPVVNGPYDPRMGVTEPGLICPTDGLDYMQTPGYHGHIRLARPVFYIQFLSTVMKITRCICIKCSKLLISKDRYRHLMELSPEQRWSQVFALASKVKRCGEDTGNGCGCKQPSKIRKEGLATLVAEWDSIEGIGPEEADKLTLTLTGEIVQTMLRRMSDDDISFMGFSPTFSRPDSMICSVLLVPSPSVRPPVKHDSQQRSEDDLSHILVNILKANNTLLEKIQANAPANVITDWTTVLQYYVATLVDNKIPGVAAVAQRSGRPLKSIKDRLNGKHGRVRGNLMGKRVDFSARSVITPDPNLSIRQLGVPMAVAKNITRPVTVNERNLAFLTKLVQNGPEVHPGANVLTRQGEDISLHFKDRDSIKLRNGDVVHRHMMDGDPVLFNRQPTLHRMSMMCHIAKIMPVGNTFRMNVGDTKPYNADFDGDEMNLHMPQDVESASELRNLAAVPWQIISPANNSSIIGIFQDSLLGSYRFTRENIHFSPREAMNLLMRFDRIDVDKLPDKDKITSFEILSQILPPLTIKYDIKAMKDGEDRKTSNNVLEIVNGTYVRGQMEKKVLGAGTKGLIHRICNDFGNMHSSNFIDDLQNIVTEYMKSSAYSVGISDLIADKDTNEQISVVITDKKRDVQGLIDQTHLGIFENKSGKSDEEEFETRVGAALGAAEKEVRRIARESLSKDNRFVIMVNAGSKGSDINISQMVSCLGQQSVDGKRIPYGFEDRTLPHYTKFDDSPNARGFIENSFISGLTPQELFFHAMGGRVGLIDTAVKTSQTGYIQRRLIKGMEDLKVEYDMTVRNNKGKVIQFAYGDDSIDPVKVEGQPLPLAKLTSEQIFAHYQMPVDDSKTGLYTTSYTKSAIKRMGGQKDKLQERCIEVITDMLEARKEMVKKVFDNKNVGSVNIPVAFHYIIGNVQGQLFINSNSLVDITPLEAFDIIDNGWERMTSLGYAQPTELFKLAYYYHLSPKELLMVKRFNRKALLLLVDQVVAGYKRALIAPGEMVGLIAAQSIGEPTTQMTLNTFHLAGVASKSNVTRGVPRIEEILSLSPNPKNPSCTVFLPKSQESDSDAARDIMYRLEHTRLREVVSSVDICFDPDDSNTLIETDALLLSQFKRFEDVLGGCLPESEAAENEMSKWIIRMEMDAEEMLERTITMDDVHFAIKNSMADQVSCIFSDYNSDNLVFRLRFQNVLKKRSASKAGKKTGKRDPLDQQDEVYILKGLQDQLLDNLVLRGVKGIDKVILRKVMDSVRESDSGAFDQKESWVLDTVGTNLIGILGLDYIDSKRTVTNDIQEVYRTLGIEAARQAIFNELTEVIEFDGAYINYHHLSLLCDRMTCNDGMVSIFRHGINSDDIGPIAKASFEETPEMFLKAARHAELDPMRGVSANVMCGQEGYFGTSAFQVVLDLDGIKEAKAIEADTRTDEEKIIEGFGGMAISDDPCAPANLAIQSNLLNIKPEDLGSADDYNPGF